MHSRNMVTSKRTIAQRRQNRRALMIFVALFLIIGLSNTIVNLVVPCPEGDVACRLN